MYLKTGDKVVVTCGKDKNKQGKITEVLRSKDKVVVEGVNIIKKHIKPTNGKDGGIIEVEAPIHVSNVMLIDPKTNKRTRISKELDKNGKKVRITKKSNSKLD